MTFLKLIFVLFVFYANSLADTTEDVTGVLDKSIDESRLENDDEYRSLHRDGPFSAFIAYRSSTSHSLATLIKVLLADHRINAFLDVEDLGGGLYDQQLWERLSAAPNFILVLSKGTLDRCKGDTEYKDVLHQEIREAVKTNRNIIPVYDEYDFPPPTDFSIEIQKALRYQGVTWEHTFNEASLEKLIGYLIDVKYLPVKVATEADSGPQVNIDE